MCTQGSYAAKRYTPSGLMRLSQDGNGLRARYAENAAEPVAGSTTWAVMTVNNWGEASSSMQRGDVPHCLLQS
jgi:hypothetical protein